MDWIKFAPLVAALTGITAAILAAIFAYANLELQKSRKRRDLYRLLKAEITNLQRHCRTSSRDLSKPAPVDVVKIKIAKYKDGNLLLFDTKEAYLLNENVCQDVMQLSLLSRNNDIYIDDITSSLTKKELAEEKAKDKIKIIVRRLDVTAELCRRVLENLDIFMKNPKKYDRPIIDW